MTLDQESQNCNRQGSRVLPYIVLAVMTLCFLAVMGAAQAEAAKSVQNFIHEASVGNEFEIESSRLALQKSQNGDVRQFAQRMVNDHTKAGSDLASAVAASNAGLPAPDMTLDTKHQKIMDKLNKASGKDFDTQYIQAQLQAHDDAVALFDSYANHGRDTSVRNFAAQTLPTLQDHQKDIHQLSTSI